MKGCVIFLFVLTEVIGQEEVLWKYEKFTKQIKDNLYNSKISISCNLEIIELSKNPDVLWNFFDAISKFPWSGLATSKKLDFGNYDQCIDIEYDYSLNKILGKYCYNGIVLNHTYYLALCLPSGCTASDYESIFNLTIFNDQNCHTKKYLTHFTIGDILMIAVLVIFAIIIFLSTTYDVYLHKNQKRSAHPIYIAFSTLTNGKKLFHTSLLPKEQFQILNGMKTTSMIFIIAFHSLDMLWLNSNVTNVNMVTNWLRDQKAVFIYTAFLCVDSFFFISGFLQAYSYMKKKSKPITTQIKNIPYQIVHRYVRLTPALAMTYFFYITLFRHLSSGPSIKSTYGKELEACHNNWWAFFLYVQNYHNNYNLCLGHTWYLSDDMQLFVLSPIILIPMAVLFGKNKNNLKMVMIAQFFINLFAILMPVVSRLYLNQEDKFFDHGTHFRVSNYTMGMMLGIFLREAKDAPFLNDISRKSMVNLIIWTIVLVSMAATSFLYHQSTYSGYSDDVRSIIHSFLRPVWCVGLSWIVYSSYHGYGGIINWILTLPTLQVASKLSYSMYLVHWLVIMQHVSSDRTRSWFNEYDVFSSFCGVFVVSTILAVIWCLCFEYPMIILESLIFGREDLQKTQKTE